MLGACKVDSVTWFLDYLFVSYMVVWGLCQIKTHSISFCVLLLLMALNLACFAVFHVKYRVALDVIGLYLGYLYARYNRMHKKWLNSRMLCVVGIIALNVAYYAFVQYSDVIMFRYNLMLLLTIDLASLVLVIHFATNSALAKKGVSTCLKFLASLSYFVYLVHMKVIDILKVAFDIDNILITIVATFSISVMVMSLYDKFVFLIRNLYNL